VRRRTGKVPNSFLPFFAMSRKCYLNEKGHGESSSFLALPFFAMSRKCYLNEKGHGESSSFLALPFFQKR